MSITTTAVDLYSSDERLPATTGSDAHHQFSRMMARLVARYQLVVVPGRPEELVRPSTSQGVSLGYGCKTIRVRLMVGREWTETADFQIQEGWANDLYSMCDRHFGWPYLAKNEISDRFMPR